MLVAVEGIAGSGKSTLRDRLLAAAVQEEIPLGHVGQFSWLSLEATRIIIALRAGRTPVDENAALAAVHRDLVLHARHNLVPARIAGHVIADRLGLSSACLLALLYHGPIERYLEPLAAADVALPEVTVLLTTPSALCLDRVRTRHPRRRFGEHPNTAARLAVLYERAGDAWQHLTGQQVLRRPVITDRDTDRLAGETLARLRGAAVPATVTNPGG